MVEDASGDVAAEDARDVNTQLQVEMIKQQRKTNVLLRARTQTVSASLAPARTCTRPVQRSSSIMHAPGSGLRLAFIPDSLYGLTVASGWTAKRAISIFF